MSFWPRSPEQSQGWRAVAPTARPPAHEYLPRKYVCGVVPSIVRNISMKALTLSYPTAIATSVTDFLCASISRAANNRAWHAQQRPLRADGLFGTLIRTQRVG